MEKAPKNTVTIQENKMGTAPMAPLLIKMAIPIMFGMLVQALYNIVDTWFISQIDTTGAAIKALSIVNPFQTLISAVATGTGIGVNAVVSRRLGRKDGSGANTAAVNGLFLGFASGLLLGLVLAFFSRPLLAMFTEPGKVLDMSTTYLTICGSLCIFNITQVMTEKLLLSTGDTMHSMITQIIGCVANIILDPILIFGYFGLPAMGVAGAAIATVAGQVLGMIYGFIRLIWGKKRQLSLSFKRFRPHGKTIGEIYNVGLPVIAMQALGSFTNACLNKILQPLSDSAISVLGLYYKVQPFAYLPVYGFSAAQLSVLSYNYGARNKKRMMSALKYSLIFMLAWMTMAMGLVHLFPGPLLSIFNANEELLTIGVSALRKISICFIFAAVGIALSNVYQAVGRGPLSLIVSISRQLGLVIPSAYILAKISGLDLVWYCFPLAEVFSSALYIAFMVFVNKRDLKPLDEPLPAVSETPPETLHA